MANFVNWGWFPFLRIDSFIGIKGSVIIYDRGGAVQIRGGKNSLEEGKISVQGGQNFSAEDPGGGQKLARKFRGGGTVWVHMIFKFAPPHPLP